MGVINNEVMNQAIEWYENLKKGLEEKMDADIHIYELIEDGMSEQSAIIEVYKSRRQNG